MDRRAAFADEANAEAVTRMARAKAGMKTFM
jgi:hypothetical protein